MNTIATDRIEESQQQSPKGIQITETNQRVALKVKPNAIIEDTEHNITEQELSYKKADILLDQRNQIEINSKKDCCIDSETGFVEQPLKYIIYPDNKVFQIWELFMTLILLVSCFLTPVEIAFTSTIVSDHSL